MMLGLTAVGVFLVSLFFSLIILSLWLRIALRYFRVSSLNQFSQLIHSITDPLIQPFNIILRQKYQPGQRYHWMAFMVLILIEFIKIILLSIL
ncbi:MAG: YggT family protein, partial [bacterium]|nr:YggT family protein [bacterium]